MVTRVPVVLLLLEFLYHSYFVIVPLPADAVTEILFKASFKHLV